MAPEARETEFRGRCTEEQKARWVRAAAAAKRTMSDWLRIVADEAAEKVLGEQDGAKRKRKGS